MKNKKYFHGLRWLPALAIAASLNTATAQITINANQTATQLAQTLAGASVTVSNATLNCPGVANGTFTVTSSNLGLDAGVLLTSGSAAFANTPNPSNSNGVAGDADLTALALVPTNDACILQFDFVPLSDSVKFQYVFGSTEYQSYTCSSFSDVFGFFISGPGISGPFSNNAKNIALVPGTTCPVGVNTINGSSATNCGNFTPPCTNNGMYFINNIGGTTVGYNGFTTVLTAQSAVTPNQTHHMKLAIADGTDFILDSGVWLKAASLTSATTTVTHCGPYTWPISGATYSASGIYYYTAPGSTQLNILDLTIYCPNTVPTISEWGLIILCLLSLSIGMVFIYKRQRALSANKA
ncbi:MAG TPA: choice-of-anchor L domain-containing protein [Chitinophagaceae bacterium]|nr:choice-of-anchor L domain-containing protein [Chitinophagaceae bacterium]